MIKEAIGKDTGIEISPYRRGANAMTSVTSSNIIHFTSVSTIGAVVILEVVVDNKRTVVGSDSSTILNCLSDSIVHQDP